MSLREAAEMALEFAEFMYGRWPFDTAEGQMAKRMSEALRQALAQPEQERLYTEKDIAAVVEAIVTSFDLRRSEHLRSLIEAKLKEKNG